MTLRTSRRKSQKIARGANVNGREGSVQNAYPRILQQQAGKENALKCPSGKRADRALFEILHADGRQGLVHLSDDGSVCPAEGACAAPDAW